jgi:hypothetical protein
MKRTGLFGVEDFVAGETAVFIYGARDLQKASYRVAQIDCFHTFALADLHS